MLSAVLAAAAALALAPRLPRLRQRYDDTALAPIDGAADRRDNPALTGQLADWAAQGAGNGATLLPWTRPKVPVPLAIARVAASEATAVRHFGYRLAGYHQLDERSRLGGILYRIGVQLRPLAWCLPRRADEHIEPERSNDDVLYEVLLKLGLDLCVPMEAQQIAGKTVHSIGGGALMTCLDAHIGVADAEGLALGMAQWREAQGTATETTAVFRDSAFENDVAKSNLAAILEQHGIKHVRSL